MIAAITEVPNRRSMNEVEHSYSLDSASRLGNEETPDGFKTFDGILTQFMVEQGIPGIGLSISYHGDVIYSQGYGVAGVNRRVTSSSRFRIASISKPLTAVGALRLVEEGHLTLEDKVFGHKGILKEFRPNYKGDKRVLQITVRHLLQHSSGWDRDQAGDPVFFNLDAIGPKDGFISPISNAFNVKLVRFIMSKKLQFAPGKRHAYSNFGYLVLGMVLERVTQQDYETYMRAVMSTVGLAGLRVGFTKRVLCDDEEVEYFNNREPALQKSIFATEGHVLPQYGSFSMENTGSYGGWVASPLEILKLLHMLQEASSRSDLDIDGQPSNSCICQLESQTKLLPCGHLNTNIAMKRDNNSRKLNDTSTESEGIQLKKTKVCSHGNRKNKNSSQSKMPKMEFDISLDNNMSCAEVDVHSVELDGSDRQLPNLHSNNTIVVSSEYPTYTSLGIPIVHAPYNSECHTSDADAYKTTDKVLNEHRQTSVLRGTKGIHRLLKPSSVAKMLEKPQYQDGDEWYGLGLDVQDSGTSFGHTGAMEGTCGTLMHHKSGFSWVMLMNAWSRDMDLDGLLKYALSTVEGYPLYVEGQTISDVFEITSQDGQEKVLILVPHSDVMLRIDEAKSSGFMVVWVNACEVNSTLLFSFILRKYAGDWSIYMNVTCSELEHVVSKEQDKMYFPVLIEPYSSAEQINNCVIFKHDETTHSERVTMSAVPVESFLKLKSEKVSENYKLICQSVAPHKGELYVSAIFTNSDQSVVSWLQISAEEFLVEQKKQLKNGRGLQYAKFYSLGDDPYVSGLWSDASAATDRFQRYGASKYGLLQELQESAATNRRLQSCSVYVSDSVVNFAVVWDSE